MIETHAHVYDEAFENDRAEMFDRAFEAGIKEIWMPNCDSTTIEGMMYLAEQYPSVCKPMMGLHPTYVKADFEKELAIVESWLERGKFIAIGEIGMDLYWDKTFIEQQKEAFFVQCQWALKHNLWIDIHNRNAFREVVEGIERVNDSRLTGIFHCFSGSLESAKKIIELGFKMGIGGVVTFKNSGLEKVLPHIDLSHIVLETDSPYLTPVPHRGKRNEVAYIEFVAKRIAEIKQVSVEEVIEQTTLTAKGI